MKRLLIILAIFGCALPCWAQRPLKEDTAVVVVVGPFVDSAGAAVTAPTIASIDITAYKNDGTAVGITPAASGSSNDMVHVDDGYYSLELTTTDTSTPGYLRLTFQISGSLIFHEDFDIMPANIYDSWYGSDKLQVDAVQHLGTAYATPTVAGVPEVDFTHMAGSTTGITNMSELFVTDWATAYDSTLNMLNVDIENGNGQDITTFLISASGIQDEVEDALELFRLDELLAADSDIDGAAPPTVGSVFHELMTKTTGSFTYDQTTDSVEAIRDLIGTAGAGLTNLPWNASWDAEAQSEATDALNAYDPPTDAEMQARTLASASYATAATQATIASYIDTEIGSIISTLSTIGGYFTTNRAEPGQGAPAASTTFLAKLDYLYKWARNKKDTDGTGTVKHYADDGTTVDQKATISTGGGTTTVGEMATGP